MNPAKRGPQACVPLLLVPSSDKWKGLHQERHLAQNLCQIEHVAHKKKWHFHIGLVGLTMTASGAVRQKGACGNCGTDG